MLNTPWTFDGCCPESLIDEESYFIMVLNSDDFWESPRTGLQIAVHPPFAVILPWRGSGDFKSEQPAEQPYGLIYSGASNDDNQDHFPDESRLLKMPLDISGYIEGIYPSWQEWIDSGRDQRGFILHQHEKHLKNLSPATLDEVKSAIDSFKLVKLISDYSLSLFSQMAETFNKHNIPAPFHWMAWHKGNQEIDDPQFDFKKCSFLELTQFLTVLIRSERFMEGSLEKRFKSGRMEELLDALYEKCTAQPL